jgi:MFS family permease
VVPSPDAPAAGSRLPRTTRQLVSDRTFGPWFWGLLVSNSGNWLFNVTAAVVVFELSGSALQVGLVSIAQFLPLVLVSPFAGALSDRVDRRKLLLASVLVSTSAATGLAVLALTVGVAAFGSAWPVIATAAGIGVGQAIAIPSLTALVPDLVADVDLESGVALTSLTFNLGRALGPATSGVLLATLGAEAAFAVNAVSFLALIAALLVIRVRQRAAAAPTTDRSVRAGLRYVRADRVVLLLLVAVATTGFAADPMITLAPPLAAEVGGGGTLVAVLVSAFGIAAAPASVVSGRLQRQLGSLTVGGLGMGSMALGLTTAALAPVPAVLVVGFASTGAGFVLALTGFTSVLQRRIPNELRGRIMALWSVAFLGNRPFAAAIDGAAADRVGPRWAMTVAITVALTGVAVAQLLRRQPMRTVADEGP